MEQSFKKELSSLNTIFEFLGTFIQSNDIDESTAFSVKLGVEEIFTNMVRYNPHKTNKVSIQLSLNRGTITVQLIDVESAPFDLTKSANVDVAVLLEQRKPGGLGIYLTNKLMDRVEYEHQNGTSTVRLVKSLESRNV